MASVAQTPAELPLSKPAQIAMRRRELGLARALGAGTGIFLLLWAPLNLVRWSHAEIAWPYFESGFFIFYGLLLLVPYAKARDPKRWRRLFGTLTVASVLFMFILIFDVLFIARLFADNKSAGAPDPGAGRMLYVFSEDSGPHPKLPFPALNCALVFIGLMQVPVVLFSRHPDWLD